MARKIKQFKKTKTPKKMSPDCYHGYAYGYGHDDVEFVVMAPSRQKLRIAWNLMSGYEIDMKLVTKAIIARVQ